MNYGFKLNELRTNKNLTQEEVARAVNINRVQYNQYENDYNTIPLRHLNNLCNYFGVSLDYIFDFSKDRNYNNYSLVINETVCAKRLKELRKEQHITQEKLAHMLNVSRTTITEYERGTNLIATSFLYTICKKYHVSADYLLGRIDDAKTI